MLILLAPGVITILCHAETFLPAIVFPGGGNAYFDEVTDLAPPRVFSTIDIHRMPGERGPAPTAEGDFASTTEDAPIAINVLSNDKRGGGDDDDDGNGNDNFGIDASSVDLSPGEGGIQSSISTPNGSYSADGNGVVTFVPALNFFGSTSIQYTVKSFADETSNPATISLSVIAVNDVPVITGPARGPINAVAGAPVTITLEDVEVNDPDNTRKDLSLAILPGDNYSVAGQSVTPAIEYSGSLPVRVQVLDGMAASEPFALELLVSKENQRPVVTGQNAVSTAEDQPVTITSSHLLVNDPDDTWPGDFTIQVGAGTNFTVLGQTITPSANFTGTLSVPVTVDDGELKSEPFALQVSVNAVNDRPQIAGQQPDPIVVSQNQPVTLAVSNLLVTDPDNATTDLSITILTGANYTFSGQTVTPSTGYSGLLTVNVAVNDLSESSDPYGLKLSVTANTPPSITGQTDLTTNEDGSIAITLANIIVNDPDNAYPADFTFRLQPGDNYTFNADVVVPSADFAGTLSVPVTVNDGVSDSQPYNLQVAVTATNDAPVITGQVPLSTSENQPIEIGLSHLTIVDPDNTDHALSILAGDNYTVSGNQITPAAGFNGTLTVRIFVSDAESNSNIFDLQIGVNPINDPPVITGQRTIEIPEATSLALTLADVTYTDADSPSPESFSLLVQPGDNYTFSTNTVTPAADFTGPLYVNVVVNDGASDSEVFPLLVTVTPVNDPPVITGQLSVSTNEETARTIGLADIIVSDPDNSYPEGFTLTVFAGANYTLTDNTILPAPDYSGPLMVQVQVSDGIQTSNIFNLAVDVLAVNDPPVITGQLPLATAEDTPVAILLSHLTVLDPDNAYPAGFTMTITPGSNYTVNGNTVLPATDFNGTLNVSIQVNDGAASSDPFAFQIQVGNANDAPTITGQVPLATNEETPVTLALAHLTVFDPDNAFPSGFTLLVSPGTNYTVAGETITPAINFSGVLTVPVRVSDGINNSPTFDFQLQVNQINDPPFFSAIPNQQIPENSTAGSLTITGISKGPFEDDQQLTFVATSSNTAVIENPVIQYSGTGTTAALSYVIKPNASGVVTLTIVAIDNGSNVAPNQNSYSASFQVDVLEINTPPTMNELNTITIMEDAEQQNVPLTGISAGAGESQALTVTVSTDKPEYFDLLEVAYNSPEPNGLLQFKMKGNISGTAQVSVTVMDNGSGVAPHVNTLTRKFSVVIQPVNDPPVFTSEPVRVAVIGEKYQYNITASDPDGDKVTISAPMKPTWAALSPAANGAATLQGQPPTGALGSFEVRLQAQDAVTVVEQSFSIYVNVRPVVESLSIVTEEDTRITFPPGFFDAGYSDANENPLQAVVITALPVSGTLSLEAQDVKPGDTIPVSSLGKMTYMPRENFFGGDSFGWNASDGYHLSVTPAKVDINVLPVNDPPRIILQEDTLRYEVNGEPAFLSPLIDIEDPDNDTLSHAVVRFHANSYRPDMDLLEFQSTSNIRGAFDFQSGILTFSGNAPMSEYRTVLRSIKYLHQNTIDPILEPKGVTFILSDGISEGQPQDKVIMLQYTFIEFEIPSGFTPNGDQANDTWIIDRPGGGLEEMDRAIISIYNKKGVLVYRAKGFDRPWDGTMNGEPLPADTYFFTIDLQLRNKKTYKGIVTILR